MEVLPQGIDAFGDHILVPFDLNIAEWPCDSIADLRLCILLVPIALRIPQEVELDELVLRARVYPVDYSQVPLAEVVLCVDNEAFPNLVLFDGLLEPDVRVVPVTQINELVEPPEIAKLVRVLQFAVFLLL